MRSLSSSVLLSYAVSRAFAADPANIIDVCNLFYGVVGCFRDLTFPDYAEPVKDASGVQTGVNIVTQQVNICDAITDAMGDNIFVANAKTNCECLFDAAHAGFQPSFKQYYDGQVNSAVTSGWFDYIYSAEKCLYDADYTISTDRAAVLKSLSATGWTVLRAPEINVPMYKKLVVALETCQFGPCNGPKIRALFASYVDNADSITDSNLTQMLNNWITLFASLKKKTADVETYAKQVQSRLKTVSSKINSVKANVCKNSACKGSTPANAFKKYSSTVSNILSLQGVPNAAQRSNANIPKMTQIARNALKYTTTAADESYYVGLANDYQINSLRDFIKAFQVTQYLPQAADDLKKYGSTFNLISNHAGAAKDGAASINSIVSVNWSKNSELAKTAAGRKVRDGLISIQKSFKNELKGPLDNLVKANKAVEDLLNQFQLRKKRLEFVSGGVPYNRWTNVDMPVPCSKEKTKTFNSGGFTKDYTWDEIKTCQYSPPKVPFVKTFIPFIKYRFV